MVKNISGITLDIVTLKGIFMEQDLISIVIPVYNAGRYLTDTINSVQAQTCDNWELIFVDDKSTDNSAEIIAEYAKTDNRIKYSLLPENVGPALARNHGIDMAKGRYLCYQDADDLWHKHKLEKQLKFMKEKDCAFSFTGYEFADENGKPINKKVFVPETYTYSQAIKSTIISTITVMFDREKLSNEDLYMPNMGAEDSATWWKILKKVDCAYGLNEILSYYRRNKGTLSANKAVAAKRIWRLYRDLEKFSIPKSVFCFTCYALSAIKRRI